MRNVDVYEVVVFNDQYGNTVRCRKDIDKRGKYFKRLGNGLIQHNIPEYDRVRYGYVIATGERREMTILADSLKVLMDGLQLQTEAREMFDYINSRFGSIDNFKRINDTVYDKFHNQTLTVSPDVSRTPQFLSPSVMKKIRYYKGN
jgi:hypothetical protein